MIRDTPHCGKTVKHTRGEARLSVQNAMSRQSSYYQSLDSVAKGRYVEKLRCIGLEIEEDPYLESDNFGKPA